MQNSFYALLLPRFQVYFNFDVSSSILFVLFRLLDFVFFLLSFFVYCIDLRDEFLIASLCVAIALAMIEESIADSL